MRKITVLLIVLFMMFQMTMELCAQESPDNNRSGSITFSMNYDQKPMEGGSLTIYRVGAIEKKTGQYQFVLLESLEGGDVAQDSLDDPKLAEELTELVREKELDGECASIKNGKAVFSNLKPGLYLVTQGKNDTAEGFYPINPFLISLPMWDGAQYVYDLSGEPKNLPQHKPDKPDDPKDPDDPKEPEEPDEPDDSDEPEEPEKTEVPEETLPQTGQLNWPIPLMASSGVLLFVAGWRLYWGKRESCEK